MADASRLSPLPVPLSVPIVVPQSVCRDFEQASRLEWLDTDHTGAFAMGTVAGVNTRRYHALLIASLHPPASRFSILPRVAETVSLDGADYQLATCQYPGAVSPRGFELLTEFRLDPFPQWTYSCGSGSLIKTICLLDRKQAVLVCYRATRACDLKVQLFTSFRDYHSLSHQNNVLRSDVELGADYLSIKPYQELPSLTVTHSGLFLQEHQWYLRHQYLRELDRGLDSEEDLFSPGSLRFSMSPDQEVWLLATLESQPASPSDQDVRALLDAERIRRLFNSAKGAAERRQSAEELTESLGGALDTATVLREVSNSAKGVAARRQSAEEVAEPLGGALDTATVLREVSNSRVSADALLQRALDQFRFTRYDGQPSLLAGYPWFTDWSRDTLISLPSLAVAGFPACETKQILGMLISQRSQGLLPNRFLDSGAQPEYNTADGTLWLFIAAGDYINRTHDLVFLRETLYPAASDILSWHRRGTFYGIHVDPADGLLWAGEPNSQLTWMDARVNGLSMTPRIGKPVEINALWYNALRITAEWSHALGLQKDAEDLEAEAVRVLTSFRGAFWNAQRNCLFDVVSVPVSDARLRPNQLFALSLPYPLLERSQARLVVDLVRQQLLTPVGLRTLEPADPSYRPRFEGSMEKRDGAYHQGTVWPWLIGPFTAAFLYAYPDSANGVAARGEKVKDLAENLGGELDTAPVLRGFLDTENSSFCRDLLANLEQQLTACCLGSLSEVYDADPPHHPGGCPAQLWSVAQLVLAAHRLKTPPNA